MGLTIKETRRLTSLGTIVTALIFALAGASAHAASLKTLYGPSSPDSMNSGVFQSRYGGDLCRTWQGEHDDVYRDCVKHTSAHEAYAPNPSWMMAHDAQVKAQQTQAVTDSAGIPKRLISQDETQRIASAYMMSYFRDPDSAQWRVLTPIKYQASTNMRAFVTCYEINAKNAYGGYVGYKAHFFVIRDGAISEHFSASSDSPLAGAEEAVAQARCKAS